MANSKLIKMFRKATIFGIAVTSIFGSPLPRTKIKEDGDDGESRIVEEDGIVSSEEITQGLWHGWGSIDEHLYRFESMENLVSWENEADGKYWKIARFLIGESPNLYSIWGIRSDDVEFSASKTFDLQDRHLFDQLCQDFNKYLKTETS